MKIMRRIFNILSIFMAFSLFSVTSCSDNNDGDDEDVISVASVALDSGIKDGISLGVSATLDIASKATVMPTNATNKVISYTSSDATVATISATGLIKAVKVGETTITATSNDNSSAKASFKATVVANTVEATSVELDASIKSGVELEVDATLDIAGKATVKPSNATNKVVNYSSSDNTVATISAAGVIKAVKVGKATITVTSASKETIKATFELTVKANVVKVTSIELDANIKDGVERVTGERLDISRMLIVKPTDAVNKAVGYSSSDNTVATINEEGLITAIKVGTTTITVTSKDVETVKATFVVTVKVNSIKVISILLDASIIDGTELAPASTLDIAGKVNVLPHNAANKAVSYASSDAAVATISEAGLITAIKVGTTTITVTSKDVETVNATFVVTVKKAGYGINIEETKRAGGVTWGWDRDVKVPVVSVVYGTQGTTDYSGGAGGIQCWVNEQKVVAQVWKYLRIYKPTLSVVRRVNMTDWINVFVEKHPDPEGWRWVSTYAFEGRDNMKLESLKNMANPVIACEFIENEDGSLTIKYKIDGVEKSVIAREFGL